MAHFRVGLAFYRGMDYGKALEVFGEVAKLYRIRLTANRHGFGKVSV